MPVILIVEDDAANQELLARFLRRASYKVILATDGMTGVGAAQEHTPDLIVMDLGLPGIDGWEATRQIRSIPKTAHIPIIALTAHALSSDVIRAIEVGFDAYETKPVVYRRLIQKIDQFVNHQPG